MLIQLVFLVIIVFVAIIPFISLAKMRSIDSRMYSIDTRLAKIERELEKLKVPENQIEQATGQPSEKEEETVVPIEEIYEEPEPIPVAKYEPVWIEESAPPVKLKPQKVSTPYRFEHLLSKIGIVTLVLGIAFFVKYAIDKNWINEVGRVGIGILTGGLLIGVAHKLRHKYNLFSALMVGGGVSVLYITITLAFREYQLFNQTPAFIILIFITIFSVILSLVYDRKELALFSLLGGFASPLMISTGEGNYIVHFSFLLILNSGMLLISMRKKWRIIGMVGFVCTLLFYWVWLVSSFKDQYAGALTFGVLFFVQFYLLALFDHFLSGRKISPFQVFVILANNLSMFASSIYIFDAAGTRIRGLITIVMAIVNAIVMIVLFRKAAVDKRLVHLIIAIVLSFVSLAVPVQLNGHVITMFWAAEIIILLWLWQKSGIKVFYAGFLLISALTLISYFMDVSHNYFTSNESLTVVFNRMFVTGLVVISAFVLSKILLARTKNMHDMMGGHFVSRGLAFAINIIPYIVLFLELRYQFEHSPVPGISPFTTTVLMVYTTIYISVLAIIFQKAIPATPWAVSLLCTYIVLYSAFGIPEIIELRKNVFAAGQHTTLFLLHYLALPAFAYIFYMLARSIRKFPKPNYTIFGWLLTAFAVLLLSVELDNTMVQIWGNASNYPYLLSNVRTIGYPILWGVLAMILMIWGLKAKEVLLRQISLGFFAFIILKFYISDIWRMSQSGRIISFVALGVILLSVSFLIQKIKVLIQDEEEPIVPEN